MNVPKKRAGSTSRRPSSSASAPEVSAKPTGTNVASDEKDWHPSRDDRVLVPVIVVSLAIVLANYLFSWHLPSIVVAAFLAMSIASLVFRFLGGVMPDTSFGFGAIKFGGSLAALVGSMWFIVSYLPAQLNMLFEPHQKDWVALSRRTGGPVKLEVAGFGSIDFPGESPLKGLDLTLAKNGDISPAAAPEFVLGRIETDDLGALEHHHKLVEDVKSFVTTDRLPVDAPARSLPPIGLRIRVLRFHAGYSEFELLDAHGHETRRGSISGRGAKIYEISKRFVLVAVVEVKHDADDPRSNYAKFAIGEIDTEFTLLVK